MAFSSRAGAFGFSTLFSSSINERSQASSSTELAPGSQVDHVSQTGQLARAGLHPNWTPTTLDHVKAVFSAEDTIRSQVDCKCLNCAVPPHTIQNCVKLRLSAAKEEGFVWGTFNVCVDNKGLPISIAGALSGPGVSLSKMASFLSLPGELRNAIYDLHFSAEHKATILYVRRRFLPTARVPPTTLSRVHILLQTETEDIAFDCFSRSPILMVSTEALHKLLEEATYFECLAIRELHVVYEGRMIRGGCRPEEAALPLAYDAFAMLGQYCRNLRSLVIQRSSRDKIQLHEDFPGIWALRSIRRLQHLRFEG